MSRTIISQSFIVHCSRTTYNKDKENEKIKKGKFPYPINKTKKHIKLLLNKGKIIPKSNTFLYFIFSLLITLTFLYVYKIKTIINNIYIYVFEKHIYFLYYKLNIYFQKIKTVILYLS